MRGDFETLPLQENFLYILPKKKALLQVAVP